MRFVLAVVAAIVLLAGESQACGSSWRAAGRSWRESGRQLFDAIGKSIGGDADKKGEWREVGQDFKQAGKNTAGAIESSITPDGESGAGSSKSK